MKPPPARRLREAYSHLSHSYAQYIGRIDHPTFKALLAHYPLETAKRLAIDYDGNVRRGLTAVCRREDGLEHKISISDMVISGGSQYIKAYRKWQGLDPFPQTLPKRNPKDQTEEIDLSSPVELVALSAKE